MAHDFVNFPELTNSQMEFYYFESPHTQIVRDFSAKVVKVTDGDTLRLRWHERDFDFPLRMLGIDAKELGAGGESAKDWLKGQIEGEEVDILINPKQRVGKWGRLLGKVMSGGIDIGEQMIREGRATTFENRREGQIPNINQVLDINQWL